MARASAATVASWVRSAGFTGAAAVTATANALASGADPGRPGGLFGTAGGDGPAQAAAARAAYAANGFAGFPTYSHGTWALYEPTAAAAVATLPAAAPARIPSPPDVIDAARTAAGNLGGPVQAAAGGSGTCSGSWATRPTGSASPR